MWTVNGDDIRMSEGEFGIALDYNLKNIVIGNGDKFVFTFKKSTNGDAVLTKTIGNVSGNKLQLLLEEADSALFPPGDYVYSLDWTRNGEFRGTLVENAKFKVGDKA